MLRRARLALLAPASAVAVGLAAATPAQALNCAQFKTAVENAASGATVTLDAGAHCHDSYQLPSTLSHFNVTIQGAGAGATLDGSSNPGQGIINGFPTAGSQIHAVIRNLTFQGGSTGSFGGGAIALDGGDIAATIERSRFLGNSAAGQTTPGGAVLARAQAGVGPVQITDSTFGDGTVGGANSAGIGGAVYASVANGGSATVARNTFKGNRASDSGGAAFVAAGSTSGTSTLTGNSFVGNAAVSGGGGVRAGGNHIVARGNSFLGNVVNTPVDTSGRGGGLELISGNSADLSGNRFDGNRITRGSQSTFSALGGAMYADVPVTVRGDRFVHNSIASATGAGESEGAGVALIACGTSTVHHRLEGVAAAANTGGAGTEGAGVYAGGCSPTAVELTMLDSTVAGNKSSGAGAVGGLAGGSLDKLTLRNSIVAGNKGGASLAGFGAGRTVSHTDACASGALAGVGNFCKPPLLEDPFHGNIHLRPKSPAISGGVGAEVAAGLQHDIDGDKRTLGLRVDMGADEFRLRDDPFKGMKLPKDTATVSHGKALVRMRCPKTVPGPCKGTLSLRAHKHSLGSAQFSIPSGTGKTVSVELNNRGRAALADAGGELAATARTKARDRAGVKRKSRTQLTLSKG